MPDNIKESTKVVETGSKQYPVRPGEPNCVYYLRTGMCAYGDDCKFHHPTYKLQDNNFPERVGEPDCAYYLKTGTCEYGSTCKYNHPRDRNGASSVKLNTVGLPMREGQESCSHYLRTGLCKYGVACKFHHPQPGANGPNPPVSGWLSYAPACTSGAYALPYLSQQTYFPLFFPSVGSTGWSPYIANMSPILLTNGLTFVEHVYPLTQSSDLTENMVKPDASSFGPFGLPFRPGQPVCPYYSLYGICKYGSGCKYDHPLMVYSYNYNPGLTTPTMVDSPHSKPMKNPSWTSEEISNVKVGADDSSGGHVGSSYSSSHNQMD